MTIVNTNAQDNPLLQPFNTAHHTAPFPLIENQHFMPALKEAMELGRSEIQVIVGNPVAPDFVNTIEADRKSVV